MSIVEDYITWAELEAAKYKKRGGNKRELIMKLNEIHLHGNITTHPGLVFMKYKIGLRFTKDKAMIGFMLLVNLFLLKKCSKN